MKKLLILMAAAFVMAACSAPAERKVMARFVPERYDDFIFENNLIAGRFYGRALEADVPGGHLVSPGIDIWAKFPGALVADKMYEGELVGKKSYHKNWGMGKDCYKVGKTLGGGASVPVGESGLLMPDHNYLSYDILEDGPEKVVFVLHYAPWEAEGKTISLDKKVTVTPDTHFCLVEDTYTFTGADSLEIAAGLFRHPSQETIAEELTLSDRYAIWEKASDQGIEPEEGMIGVAVCVPGATSVRITEDGVHGLCTRFVRSGEPFVYSFGSCWSAGDITTPADWFSTVRAQ